MNFPPPENVFNRWYPLIPHPVQLELINDNIRFKVVPAGRRSGKTERAKRFIIKQMILHPGKYFIAAPTRQHVKQIYWDDLKEMCSFFTFINSDCIRETELKIIVPYIQSSVTLVGLDVPQRFEGISWTGGIIDEIADIHPNAWGDNISPALDTLHPNGNKAWCWLIGVPDGFNHFFNLAEYARNSGDPDWKLYHWKSADVLPPETIAAAKNRLSEKQFKQEYEASFETTSGRVYNDYSNNNHTFRTLKSSDQILWCHDFNFSPMSSAICIREKENLFVVGEIILQSAVARQSALEFINKYQDHQNKDLILYGDPAGKAGEKHGHASDYIELEKTLRENGWKVIRKVKNAAPAIRDRQNAVRSKIATCDGNKSFFINPKLAPWCNDAMFKTQIKEGSSFQEQESPHQHVTTAIGYLIDMEWPVNSVHTPLPQHVLLPTAHYYNG